MLKMSFFIFENVFLVYVNVGKNVKGLLNFIIFETFSEHFGISSK